MQSAKTTRIMSIGWPSRSVSLNLLLYSLFWFLQVVVDGRLYDVRFRYTTVFSLRLTSSLFKKISNCLLLILQLIRLDTAHLRVPSGCRWLINSNAFLELVHLDECLLASHLAISSESHIHASSVVKIKRTAHLSLIVDALESAERLFQKSTNIRDWMALAIWCILIYAVYLRVALFLSAWECFEPECACLGP